MTKIIKPTVITVTTADDDELLLQQVTDIERTVQPYDYWDRQAITDMLKLQHNHCWAILNPNTNKSNKSEVVAYCIFSTVFEVGEIFRIGTHPNFKRKGYAKCLITQIIDQMPKRDLQTILLEVRSDNEAALNLYHKIGFEVIDQRVGYYSGNSIRLNSTLNTQVASKLDTKNLEKTPESSHRIDTCDAQVMQYRV